MKKFFSLLSLIVMLGLVTVSCLDDKETRQETTLIYSGELCFNYVHDRETGETLINVNPSYEMKYDFVAQTVTVTITGLQVSPQLSGLSFRLPALPFKVSQDSPYYTTTASDVVPVGAGQSYVINQFKLQAIPMRYIDGALCPVYQINYTINGRYEVTVMPTNPVLVGRTTAIRTDNGSDSEFTVKNSVVSAIVDPAKMLAKVTVFKTEFEQGMPETSLVFKDVPVEVYQQGFRLKTAENVDLTVYNTNNVPMNQCTYSNFNYVFNLTTGSTYTSFDVDLSSKSDEYYTFGAFKVDQKLGYLFEVEK